MQLDKNHAWLSPSRHCPSPHCDARPDGIDISLLVIHCISLPPREFGGGYIDDLFLGRLDSNAHPYFAEIAHLRVSAHLLIERDGTITQYVPFTQRAWHAGQSSFEGRERCNDFSIGIELEGYEELPYTTAQYAQLAQVIPLLQVAFPAITIDRMVGHSDIAPARKTDPGSAFDWLRLRADLKTGYD